MPSPSVRQIGPLDLDRLIEIYARVLPANSEARSDQGKRLLAEIPEPAQGLVEGRLNFEGGRAQVAEGVIMKLRDAGRPVKGREAIGYFLRALARQSGDYNDIHFIEDLFRRYAIEEAVVEAELPPERWHGDVSKASDYEVIVEENTLQPVAFLERAMAASKAVVHIQAPCGLGTGFLLGNGLVVTCNHVLPSQRDLLNTFVTFNFQLNAQHVPLDRKIAMPNVQGPFFTNPFTDLDFTVFSLNEADIPDDAQPLRVAEGGVLPGDRVSIIQHPEGQRKMISMRNNLVQYSDDRVLQYTTSTLPGSSGSPVLDEELRVVGIHTKGSKQLMEPLSGKFFARNQGSNIHAVLSTLESRNPELHARLLGSI